MVNSSYHCFTAPTAAAETCAIATGLATLPTLEPERRRCQRRRSIPPSKARGGGRAAGHRPVPVHLLHLPTPLLPEPHHSQPRREAPAERGRGRLPLSCSCRRRAGQRDPHRSRDPGDDVAVSPPPAAGGPGPGFRGEVPRVAAEAVAGELRAVLQLQPLLQHQRLPRPPLQLHAVHGDRAAVSCTAAQPNCTGHRGCSEGIICLRAGKQKRTCVLARLGEQRRRRKH